MTRLVSQFEAYKECDTQEYYKKADLILDSSSGLGLIACCPALGTGFIVSGAMLS